MKKSGSGQSSTAESDEVGFVYIYNFTQWRLRPTLNGNSLDSIPALSITVPGRQPSSLPVLRVNSQETSEAKFADFSDLRLRYEGSQGTDFEALVQIFRRDVPLIDDLQMTVFHKFLVVSSNGKFVTTVPSLAANGAVRRGLARRGT